MPFAVVEFHLQAEVIIVDGDHETRHLDRQEGDQHASSHPWGLAVTVGHANMML